MKTLFVSLFMLLGLTLSAQKIVYIQPLGNVPIQTLNVIKSSVENFYGYKCIIKPKVEFTKDILASSKTRYEAGKILKKFNTNKNLLIITEKDIAYKKGTINEYGIFGLGYRPGTTCVVSTFRIKRNVSKSIFHNRLIKICLHEIGHNLGLSHCNYHRQCMMNDARGTIKQVDEEKIWLCGNCKKMIKKP
jgi:archaemetzincin